MACPAPEKWDQLKFLENGARKIFSGFYVTTYAAGIQTAFPPRPVR